MNSKSGIMIVFPLVVILMLSLGSIGLGRKYEMDMPTDAEGLFTDAEANVDPVKAISNERSTENLTDKIDQFYNGSINETNNYVDTWYNWKDSWWNYRMFATNLKTSLDEVFGDIDGHNTMAEILKERQIESDELSEDEYDLLTKEEVEEVVKLDPETLDKYEDIQSGLGSTILGITSSNFFLALVIAMVGILLVMGFGLFGSGFEGRSVSLIVRFIFFFSLWSIMSIFAQPILMDIPLFGGVVWMGLTLMYTLGIVMDSEAM